MSNLLLLGCGGPIIVSPWGRPSANWISWTGAGSDPTQTNNTADGQLNDDVSGTHWLSGGANTAGGDTNRPIWLSLGLNGYPAWDFNGTSSNTTCHHAVRGGSGYTGELTSIVVLQVAVTTGTRRIFSGNSSAKTHVEVISGGAVRAYNGGSTSNTGAVLTANTPVILAFRWKTGEGCKTWVNGVATGTIISGHTQYKGADTSTNNFLGRDYTSGNAGFQGDLAAIGFAYSALSDSVIEADSLTLKSRYGIS